MGKCRGTPVPPHSSETGLFLLPPSFPPFLPGCSGPLSDGTHCSQLSFSQGKPTLRLGGPEEESSIRVPVPSGRGTGHVFGHLLSTGWRSRPLMAISPFCPLNKHLRCGYHPGSECRCHLEIRGQSDVWHTAIMHFRNIIHEEFIKLEECLKWNIHIK